MKSKLAAVVGAAAGYVLGTKAGRERYEQIKKTTRKLWNDPRVQEKRHSAENAAQDLARDAGGSLKDAAGHVQDAAKEKTAGSDDLRNRP